MWWTLQEKQFFHVFFFAVKLIKATNAKSQTTHPKLQFAIYRQHESTGAKVSNFFQMTMDTNFKSMR